MCEIVFDPSVPPYIKCVINVTFSLQFCVIVFKMCFKQSCLSAAILKYTNGTKKLWDFNIAADLQELSKIQNYVYMYVIEDILKTSTQNGNEVVTHITRMMYGRREVYFKFHTFSRRAVYHWHFTMQAWEHGQSCQITGKGLISDIQ